MAQNASVAYQYLWRDYSQPSYQNLVLTLTNVECVALLGFLSVWFAYAQTRAWVVHRYLLIRFLRPIQLPQPDDSENLYRLSQATAIALLFRRAKRRQESHRMTSVSPWFGGSSIVVGLLFIIAGIVAPYLLTGGAGLATVQSLGTRTCDGVQDQMEPSYDLAMSFYQQCRLNYSAEFSACNYKTEFLKHPTPSVKVAFPGWSSPRPKPAESMELSVPLVIEYDDAAPTDYGLNVDGSIRQGHRLECTPVPVQRYYVATSDPGPDDTVYWIGYPPDLINPEATHASIGDTRSHHLYSPPLDIQLNFSTMVFDRMVYSAARQRLKQNFVYDNFHPSLGSDHGDPFVAMFQFSPVPALVPLYEEWLDTISLADAPYPNRLFVNSNLGPTAIHCTEQYQLCYEADCTGWNTADHSVTKMGQMLQKWYTADIVAEMLAPQILLMKMNSVIGFLRADTGGEMMAKRVLNADAEKYPEPAQWHWEVRSWFNLAMLTTRTGLYLSSRGQRPHTHRDNYLLTNSSWICNKVLYLDVDSIYSNVNFIGLMSTFAGLTFIVFLSYADILLAAAKPGIKRCRIVWQAICMISGTWIPGLPGWNFVFTWFRERNWSEGIQPVNRPMPHENSRSTHFLRGGSALILAVIPFSRQTSHVQGDGYIDDSEIPSASINLPQLTR
jgi:hypothetical protein